MENFPKKKKKILLCFLGILKKWQLIFYGTVTNPIRLRSPASKPFAFPRPQEQPYYLSSGFNHFQNYPNIYSGQGSEIKSTAVSPFGKYFTIFKSSSGYTT